jgi:hypothetical protein
VLFGAGLSLGVSALVGWIDAARRLSRIMARSDWPHQYQQWSLLAAIRTTGVPLHVAWAVYLVAAALLTATTMRALARLRVASVDATRTGTAFARAAGLVALFVAVVSPYLFYYDDVLLAGPGVVFALVPDARSRGERRVTVACVALTFVIGFGMRWLRPFSPMGLVAGVWLAIEARAASAWASNATSESARR